MANTVGPFRLYSAQEWRAAGFLFAGYLIAYELAVLYIPSVTPLYPASAGAIVGLFFGGVRIWPIVLLASALATWRNGFPLPYLLLFPLGETLQAVAGARLLRSAHVDPVFRRYRDMFYFVVSAVLASFIVPAFRTVADAFTGTPLSFEAYGYAYTAMLASLFVLVPFLLRWLAKPRFNRHLKEWAEVVIVFAILIALDVAIFTFRIPAVLNVPLVYLLTIPFFWVALRLRPRFVSLAVLITAVLGFHSVLLIATPETLLTQMYQMEAFLITFGLIFYIVVSLEEDRRVNTNIMRTQLSMLENAMARVTSESNAKNDFIAILAHELRNPLAPIMSGIDLLKMKDSRDPEETSTLALMEDRMDTVRRLLDDLLDISRISEGKIRLKKEEVDLEEVLRRAILSTDHYIKERHQSLILRLPQKKKYVLGDPVRLEQVFTNLLTNASKYSNPGDTITVKMEREGECVEVTVTDQGMGINPKELQAIFTPFHQLEQGSKKGLGIGLALVRSFVEMHDGSVVAKSEGRGQGSSFTVRLPILHTVERIIEKGAKREQTAKTRARSGLHLLVVDDNDAAAAGIGRLLELRGCRVSYAYDGSQALERAIDLKPDVIILDLGLPDQDGYSVAKEMRVDGYTGKLIALTGFSTDEAKEKGKEAGFDHYLVKPAGLSDLRHAIPELG